MKKKIAKLASLFLCLAAMNAKAQTNTFPASGNVGIGTTTPAAKLHLYNGAGQTLQFLTGSNSSGYAASIGVNDNGVNFSNTSAIRGFNFSNSGGQRINFLTGDNSSSYAMNIGVNDDGINFSNTSTFRGFNFSNSGGQRITFLTGGNSSPYAMNIGVNDDGINFSNSSSIRGFNFKNANGNLLSIASSGSITIGAISSTPSGYKLYVDQGILTEKVKVAVSGTAQWADYVFHKDYKLPSLGEVEKYIQQNKHLPDIPSAEEMVKEGNDLGTTDAKLLAKIEELTLYLIEMKKENGNMLQQIEHLTTEVNNLKKMNK